jgi:hypothetical protein
MAKIFVRTLLTLLCLLIQSGLFAYTDWVQNTYLGMSVESTYYFFDLGTSSKASMLYNYAGVGADLTQGTSKIVVKIDGSPNTYSGYNICTGTITSDLTNAPYYIQGTRRFKKLNSSGAYEDLVDLTTRWELVNNPATGANQDTCMYEFIFNNPTLTTHYVSLRLELDTMVNKVDGTNISVDNGFTTIAWDTVWYKSSGQIPGNWWDYDINPNFGTPNIVGRGYLKNNSYGLPATEPDIYEVANWNTVNGASQWTIAPSTAAIGSDSAVVLWWVNGSSPLSPGYEIAPGESLTFIAYYGLNQEKLLTTPTITQTFTDSPTITQTPTITLTDTVTDTYTSTKTLTVTMTSSFTYTFTDTPTFTVTPTLTLTCTDTPTFTVTDTFSSTPTITQTWTVTYTYTITMTATVTSTLTPTPPPLVLALKGNFPNPFVDDTHIVYWLSVDALVQVKVYTVSGEVVRISGDIAGKKGYNEYFWDGLNITGRPVASGVFIYRVYASTPRNENASAFAKAACVK